LPRGSSTRSDPAETPRSNEVATYRALPYKPTSKLKASDDPPFPDEFGWTAKEFRDDAGDLYERQRDGENERWLAVIERESTDPSRRYVRIPKPGHVDHGDRLDRVDDFDWIVMVVRGLIEDCQERRLFPRRPAKMGIAFRQLEKAVIELRRAYAGFYPDETERAPKPQGERKTSGERKPGEPSCLL
jgi:hypothetical protein